MGEDYNYDPTPAVWALWRSYMGCEYVDDEGGTVFYRNRHGKAVRDYEPPADSKTGTSPDIQIL